MPAAIAASTIAAGGKLFIEKQSLEYSGIVKNQLGNMVS
jgi:hypothetical protein